MCNDCITRDEVKSLMSSYGTPVGAQLFVGAAELQYFDSTGKGLANSAWRCWAIQNGSNGTEDARGKFFVGYSSGDSDFGTADGTGGSKTFTLDAANLPDHQHHIFDTSANGTDTADLTTSLDDHNSGTSAAYIQVGNDQASGAPTAYPGAKTGYPVETNGTAKSHIPPFMVRIPVEKICADYTL